MPQRCGPRTGLKDLNRGVSAHARRVEELAGDRVYRRAIVNQEKLNPVAFRGIDARQADEMKFPVAGGAREAREARG